MLQSGYCGSRLGGKELQEGKRSQRQSQLSSFFFLSVGDTTEVCACVCVRERDRTQTCGSVPAAQCFDSYFMTLFVFSLLRAAINLPGTHFFSVLRQNLKNTNKQTKTHTPASMRVEESTIFVVVVACSEPPGPDQSRGAWGRFGGLLLLSVSCSVLTGHNYTFLFLSFLFFSS